MARIRKKIGYLKFLMVDVLPFLGKARQAKRKEAYFDGYIDTLASLPEGGSEDYEIHILCGKKQRNMGIWATWSLMRFLPRARLYVHSDGTLDGNDMARWKDKIGNLHFVEKDERNARVSEKISGKYPILHDWRMKNWASTKLVDFHLFGSANKLILLDSDVLCFKRPGDLISALSSQAKIMLWNRDVSTCYPAPETEISSIVGEKIPGRLNSGFLLVSRFDDGDFEYLEGKLYLLKRDGKIDLNHFWSEQAFYAVCSPRFSLARPFPEIYDVTLGKTGDSAVIRHYVSSVRIRPRFYLEGVKMILKNLEIDGSARKS